MNTGNMLKEIESCNKRNCTRSKWQCAPEEIASYDIGVIFIGININANNLPSIEDVTRVLRRA